MIENRSGAGAVIAAEVAARAAPDGYTVHLGQHGSFASAPSLYKNLSYDPLKDFAPITFYASVPLLIVAHPSLPPASLKELVEYARPRPGVINYGSGGAGLIEQSNNHDNPNPTRLPFSASPFPPPCAENMVSKKVFATKKKDFVRIRTKKKVFAGF